MAKTTDKKKFRFSQEQDVFLLREVLATNPFSNDGKNQKEKWTKIADHLNACDKGFKVDQRLCREHTDLLVKKFKSDNRESLKR